MSLFSRKKRSSQVNNLKHSGKRLLLVSGCMLSLFMLAPSMNNSVVDSFTGTIEAQAAEATFSQFWKEDASGWHVYDNNGNMIKNAWLCDDAVSGNGQNVWYLLDENGNMITAGLVQDLTGSYYSLETNHNGFYGMLRYQSRNYDGVDLSLESSHSGAFSAILNQDGIEALKSKYGVTTVNISNDNCVYTSTFKSSSSNNNPGGGSGGGATENQTNTNTDIDYSLGGVFEDTKEPGTGGGSTTEDRLDIKGQ